MINPEAKKSIIFLMALNGVPQRNIAEKFGMTKNEIHRIVGEKANDNHVVDNMQDLREYQIWREKIITKELENLWNLIGQ